MYWLKVIFYSIILTLAGCGGDSAPNNNNSGGSDGGGTEVTPPTIPPSSKSIRVMDFHLTFDTNTEIDALNVNFSTFVSSMEGKHLSLTKVEPLTKDDQCQVLKIQSRLIQFAISPKIAKTCSYRYTVTDGETFESAIGRVTTTSKKRESAAREASSTTDLPLVSKSTVVGNSLTFNLADELSSELSKMTNPMFSEAIVAYGTGVPIIDETGSVTYNAIEAGYSLTYFYILDDNNTSDDKSDDVIYNGTLVIDISGIKNNPPNINTPEDYPKRLQTGSEAVIDVTPYISDLEGDDVQLVHVHAENIDVELTSPYDVNNLSFNAMSNKLGLYTVYYTVYDHEDNGFSSGQLNLTFVESRAGKVRLGFNSLLKVYEGGSIGGISSSSHFIDNVKKLSEYLTNNNVKATDIKSVGLDAFLINLSNGESAILSSASNSDSYKILPESFIYDWVYSFQKLHLGWGLIGYTYNPSDSSITAINQIVGTSAACPKDYIRKFNASEYKNNVESWYIVENGTRSTGLILKHKGEDTLTIIKPCTAESFSIPAPTVNYERCMFIDDVNISCLTSDHKLKMPFEDSATEAVDFIKNLIKLDITISKIQLVGSKIYVLDTDKRLHVFADNATYANDDDNKVGTLEIPNVINFVASSYYFDYWLDDESFHGVGYNAIQEDGLSSGKMIDVSLDFNKIKDIKNNIQQVYRNSSTLLFITKDEKIYTFSHLGLIEETSINLSEVKSIVSDSTSMMSGANTAFTGQGRNVFIVNLNSESDKWRVLAPLSSLIPTYDCPAPVLNLDDDESLLIKSPCIYWGFKFNGAITMSGEADLYAFPEELFSDSDFLTDLIDLDNDGMSNDVEISGCSLLDSTINNEYPCSSYFLNDSDYDAVNDALEMLYSHSDSFKSDFSHNKDRHVLPGTSDAYKDINSNGVSDKFD
ncbi:hypothetical protein NB663_19985 [Vibrio parahaemolyticus]|uniref:hypothetical protein n=3 Tax=Vibrio parahaemolyticus TaxID=670 RepID=UPI00215BBC91|nr:hypothetical protein [Vibrio parahaemolyticus]MCR9782792.1 hypothetical protein [Vibrio parahaemolyticus]